MTEPYPANNATAMSAKATPLAARREAPSLHCPQLYLTRLQLMALALFKYLRLVSTYFELALPLNELFRLSLRAEKDHEHNHLWPTRDLASEAQTSAWAS